MSEPRYTIEQIELLRRLVRTGLSRDEIVHACDTMAKLDHEFGPLPNNKMDQPAAVVVTAAAASPPINSYHASQQLTVTSRNAVAGGDVMGQDPGSPTNRTSLVSLLSTMGHGGLGGYLENGDSRLNLDDFTVTNEEVEALFRQGHMNVKEDIKDFLNKHGLSQNQISRSTGISQSYISQFLLHGYVMRRSTQAILYRWYLAKRKELEAMDVLSSADQETLPTPNEQRTPQRNRPLLPKTQTQRFSPYQTPSQAPPANMSFGGKRRERFVWKDNCLKVLEAYFKKNPYPNDMERIRLSDACNAMQQIPGTELAEHNKVNPSKVYNWFANRRKDANRKKRMAAENLITRNASHDDGSLPDVGDYLDDTSTDLTQDGDMTGALGENGNGDMIDQLDSEGADQDQDPSEVANQLVEVNNSIMTLMKAVEERPEDATIVKTESDT